MIRLFNTYFPLRTLILLVSEIVLVSCAFIAATILRFGSEDASLILNYEYGFVKIALVTGIVTLCMYYFDLYDSFVLSNRREVITRLVQVIGTSSVILALVYYGYPSLRLARGIFLIGTALVCLSLVIARKLFSIVNQSTRLARRVLFVGEGSVGSQLAFEVEKRPELGVQLLGYVAERATAPGYKNGLQKLGDLNQLGSLVKEKGVSSVVVTMADRRGALPVEELLELKAHGLRIEDGADFYENVTGRIQLESLRLSWLLFSPGFCVSKKLLLYKRVFSLVFSLIGIVLTLPLTVIIALAIRLDSPGPVIFEQKRVGKGGKKFTLFKFRSMRHGVNGSEPAQRNDERCTRVGKWLRASRLDELPQFYNILRGDIDFIGPRPFVPSQEEDLAEKIPFYRQRWSIKPGATGWAQINRGYCSTLEDNEEKLSYDLFYIKNVSIGLDLLILFKTAKILLLGRGGR